MPLPQDVAKWANWQIMFATSTGNVRRNALSDFTNIKANGKIAMKLEEGERLIAVRPCSEAEDVLLATRNGKCIRFPAGDVRVFSGRTSTGVRGIKLADSDEVISMSMLRHATFDIAERDAYLRMAKRRRGGDIEPGEAAANGNGNGNGHADGEAPEPQVPAVTLGEERYASFAVQEEFILSVTERGFGKRTSAYEYRITNRGGQGIANIETSERNGPVVASFPVRHEDQIMLVTNRGQLIRTPVDGIRIAGRATQGVTLFRVEEGERVMSVTRLGDENDTETANGGNGGDGPPVGGAGNG
jgi:DNA gyrase subunit A